MDILLLLDEIRAIAHNGLEFVTDLYDRDWCLVSKTSKYTQFVYVSPIWVYTL